MRRLFLLCVIGGVMFTTPLSRAAVQIDDPNTFIANNPDGNKYTFVKHYITALTYLKTNSERQKNQPPFTPDNLDQPGFIERITNNLLQDNANLRVARNIVERYRDPDHGLILKAADMFTRFCNRQIDLNNEERQLYEYLQDVRQTGGLVPFDRKYFLQQQKDIAAKRKNNSEQLLEASLLIQKILISSKTDKYGEFVFLGVTEAERKKLLDHFSEFSGPAFTGELRQGQTFLEASVAAIHQILLDPSLRPVDRN